jgi:hypothetical protein
VRRLSRTVGVPHAAPSRYDSTRPPSNSACRLPRACWLLTRKLPEWRIKPNSKQRRPEQSSQNTHHSAKADSDGHNDERKQNWREKLIRAVPVQNDQQRSGKAAKNESDRRVDQSEPLKPLLLHAADTQASLSP